MLSLSHHQFSLIDVNHDIDQLTHRTPNNFYTLFDQTLDITQFISDTFYQDYYKSTGRPRTFPLEGMIKLFIVQHILGISHLNTLCFVINTSFELRAFLRFPRAPNPSQLSRFKRRFYDHIVCLFHQLVDDTDTLARALNQQLANILITDTTGFEFYVKENNPKFFQAKLKSAKALAKTDFAKNNFDHFKPDAYAASKMPKYARFNAPTTQRPIRCQFPYSRTFYLLC